MVPDFARYLDDKAGNPDRATCFENLNRSACHKLVPAIRNIQIDFIFANNRIGFSLLPAIKNQIEYSPTQLLIPIAKDQEFCAVLGRSDLVGYSDRCTIRQQVNIELKGFRDRGG